MAFPIPSTISPSLKCSLSKIRLFSKRKDSSFNCKIAGVSDFKLNVANMNGCCRFFSYKLKRVPKLR
jgi:hypothetical protein